MTTYEYKVVPAPAKGERARGVKGAEGRFAHVLERVMNAMAVEGWEYQRAETLPSDERSGLAGSVTIWRNVLVFRRARASDVAAFQPRQLEAPKPYVLATPVEPIAQAPDAPARGGDATGATTPITDKTADAPSAPDPDDGWQAPAPRLVGASGDNGVEETQDLRQMSSILKARAAKLTGRDTPTKS